MKHPTSFDVTAAVETIVDSLRVRLPAVVAREVAKQLQARRRADLEATTARALTARRARGIPDDDATGAPP